MDSCHIITATFKGLPLYVLCQSHILAVDLGRVINNDTVKTSLIGPTVVAGL